MPAEKGTYKDKANGTTVQAFRLEEEDLGTIAAYFGVKVRQPDRFSMSPYVLVIKAGMSVEIQIGDWVIKEEDLAQSLCPGSLFANSFELIKLDE